MADEYTAAALKAIEDLRELLSRRDFLDAEIEKKRRYLHTSIGQVSPQDRPGIESQVDMLTRNLSGLTEAVRQALRFAGADGGEKQGFVTAAQVRDLIMDSGFSFSSYRSNPLASIHTVLTRRLKPKELEMKKINGVMHFRWKGKYELEDVRIAQIMN